MESEFDADVTSADASISIKMNEGTINAGSALFEDDQTHLKHGDLVELVRIADPLISCGIPRNEPGILAAALWIAMVHEVVTLISRDIIAFSPKDQVHEHINMLCDKVSQQMSLAGLSGPAFERSEVTSCAVSINMNADKFINECRDRVYFELLNGQTRATEMEISEKERETLKDEWIKDLPKDFTPFLPLDEIIKTERERLKDPFHFHVSMKAMAHLVYKIISHVVDVFDDYISVIVDATIFGFGEAALTLSTMLITGFVMAALYKAKLLRISADSNLDSDQDPLHASKDMPTKMIALSCEAKPKPSARSTEGDAGAAVDEEAAKKDKKSNNLTALQILLFTLLPILPARDNWVNLWLGVKLRRETSTDKQIYLSKQRDTLRQNASRMEFESVQYQRIPQFILQITLLAKSSLSTTPWLLLGTIGKNACTICHSFSTRRYTGVVPPNYKGMILSLLINLSYRGSFLAAIGLFVATCPVSLIVVVLLIRYQLSFIHRLRQTRDAYLNPTMSILASMRTLCRARPIVCGITLYVKCGMYYLFAPFELREDFNLMLPYFNLNTLIQFTDMMVFLTFYVGFTDSVHIILLASIFCLFAAKFILEPLNDKLDLLRH